MRSLAEIRFRVRQEAANVWMLWNPPQSKQKLGGALAGLPPAEEIARQLRESDAAKPYRDEVVRLAEDVLAHRFHLLGLNPVDLGPSIAWRRDFVHGQETGLEYFRRIPYLDFAKSGDHKFIWELNRHQHLVLLAQAYLLTGRPEFLAEIPRQLDHWMSENPFQRGINWTSALEVGFRALSWVWVLHLIGQHLEESFKRRLLNSLYQHGMHLEFNLSVYFSPNTHLIGEAVALYTLGQIFAESPASGAWRELGSRIALEEMRRQVRVDGSHFEQSFYYHLYSVDIFLFFLLIAGKEAPDWFKERLGRMVEYLDAVVSTKGILPTVGDEDGGRLFHPYGDRRLFAQATLATCSILFDKPEWTRNRQAVFEQAAWWVGATSAASAPPITPQSQWFPDAGVAVMRSQAAHVIIDAGPFGTGTAGHSHADTLSIVAFRDGEELLIDPGTFTYISDPQARQRFRGTAAHNTISICAADAAVEQAEAEGPFRWANTPSVELLHWNSTADCDLLDARCEYAGFTHRRSVVLHKPSLLVVVDQVSGNGVYRIEQRWLCPRALEGSFLTTLPEARRQDAERSTAFGSSEPATRWVSCQDAALPATLAALISFGDPVRLQRLGREADRVLVEYEGGAVRVPDSGPPEVVA